MRNTGLFLALILLLSMSFISAVEFKIVEDNIKENIVVSGNDTIIQREGWVAKDSEGWVFAMPYEYNGQNYLCSVDTRATSVNDLEAIPLAISNESWEGQQGVNFNNLDNLDKTDPTLLSTGELVGTIIPASESGNSIDRYGYCYIPTENNKKIKMFNNSVYFELINNTWIQKESVAYEQDGYLIQILDSSRDIIEGEEAVWMIDNSSKRFFWDAPSDAYPIKKFGYRIWNNERGMTFNEDMGRLEQTPRYTLTDSINNIYNKEEVFLNFDSFIYKDENTITGAEVYPVRNGYTFEGLTECTQESTEFASYAKCLWRIRYWDIMFEGDIYNTDPETEFVYTEGTFSVDTFHAEFTPLGARLETPILNMNFNSDNETGGYVQDNSIYNNYGTNNGATWNSSCGVTDAGNDLGGCFDFDGTDNNIYIEQDDSITFGDGTKDYPFSLSIWFNSDSISSTQALLSKYNGGGDREFLMFLLGSKLYFRAYDDSAGGFIGRYYNTALSSDQWYHTTITYSGNSTNEGFSIYINGVRVDDNDADSGSYIAMEAMASGPTIGARTDSGWYFNGQLDNPQVFNRVLSTSEIQTLYNGTTNNTNYYGKYANEGNFSSLVFYNESSTYWNVTQSIADSDYIDTLDYVNQSGLVSYWDFNNDLSDHNAGYEYTVYQATETLTRGDMVKGYEFDGTNDYLYHDVASYGSTSTGTVVAWVYQDVQATSDIIFSSGDDGSNRWFYTGINSNGKPYIGTYDTGDSPKGNAVVSNGTVSLDGWHQIIYTSDASDWHIYIDGIKQNLTISSGSNTGGWLSGVGFRDHITIGAQEYNGARNAYFDGKIDDVLVFNRTLSDSEILDLYAMQSTNGDYYGVDMFEEYAVFDGSNDRLSVADDDSLSFGNGTDDEPFSTSTWIKVNDDTSYQNIIIKTDGANTEWVVTLRYPGGSTFQPALILYDGTAYEGRRDDTAITLGEWHHLVTTYDGRGGDDAGAGIDIYLDNVLVDDTEFDSGTYTAMDNENYPVYFGAKSNTLYFNGFQDESMIFNKSLTSSEVTELYNARFNLDDYTNDNLVSHWNFDGDFNDDVGGHDATVVSGVYTTDGLVSYWTLDESFDDLVGGNDGTQSGGVTNATGLSSGAMNFDGTDDYIGLSSNTLTDFSLSAWFNSDEIKGHILSDSTSESRLFISTRDIGVTFSDSTTKELTLDNMDTNIWYHVTATYDSSILTFYINGENISSSSHSSKSFIYDSIGKVRGSATAITNFSGQIDEVLIYDRSLDTSEVQDLYKAGLSQHADTNVSLQTRTADSYNISDAGLVGLWGLNGDANDELGVNNGSSGTEVYNESYGLVGQGADFDKGTPISLTETTLPQTFTISMWMNPDVPSTGYWLPLGNTGGDFLGIRDLADHVSTISCAGSTKESPLLISETQGIWNSVTWSNNATGLYFYHNGELTKTSTACADFDYAILGGAYSATYDYDGQIDEVRIYNRSLSASEIQNLYELGNYHIEWSDWDDEGKIEDGESKILTNASQKSKFIQIKDVLNTDDTDISPYVLNYSVTEFPNTAPVIDNLILNATSTDNYTTDNLTGFITTTDYDDNNVTSFYNWYKNDTINASRIIEDGLVAYYPLDNDPYDYYGNNDAINQGATHNLNTGKVLGNYNFDGTSNDYLYSTDNIGISGNEPRTMSAWAKANSASQDNWAMIAAFGAGASSNAMWFGADDSGTDWEFSFWGGAYDYDTGIDIDTEWHHFVWIYNGTDYFGYIDNDLKVSGTATIDTTDSQLYIGKHLTTSWNFDGQIDEVQVHNKALSPEEITQLYEGTKSGHMVIDSDQTTTGETWTLEANACDYLECSNYQNASIYVNETAAPTDITNPLWFNNKTNLTTTTLQNDVVYFNITFTDGEQSGGDYTFSYYNTTDWINTTSTWANNTEIKVEKTITADIGFINWTWYFNDSINSNQTDTWSLYLTADPTLPTINIVSPETTTYTEHQTELLFTHTNSSMANCWYSLDEGVTNTSITGCDNVTGITSEEESNTWTVWINDSEGSTSDSVTFTVDFPPTVTINNPIDPTDLIFSYQMSCTDTIGTDTLWYNWMGTNYTYTTPTNLNGPVGNYNIQSWCNDTYGSVDTTTTNFDIVGAGSNVTIGEVATTLSCRYKRYGYYNTKLPWMRQKNCI